MSEHDFSTLNLTAGEKLAGAYTLKNPLDGEAGLPVWLAHDDELDRDVTLHFLPDAVRADARAMSELRAAVRRNRQLIHPRIVRVHDLIEEEKWAAITMDYIEGESLASALRKKLNRFFEVSEVAPWVAQICHTLEDAHKIELFHGDLAPVNLIMGKTGDVHVANFGISRVVLDVLGRAHQPVRGEGDIAYASPQQLDGERLAKSDDIYALGVVLYELLTGKPPFHSADLLAQIRRNTAPPVAERRAELKIEGEPIPPVWEETIARCLEKDSKERPKSAQEVAGKLSMEKSAAGMKSPVETVKPHEEAATSIKVETKTSDLADETPTLAEAQKQATPEVKSEPLTSAKATVPSAVSLAAKVVSKSTPPAREDGIGDSSHGREHAAPMFSSEHPAEEKSATEFSDAGGSGEEGEPLVKPVPGKHFPRSSFLALPSEGQKKSSAPKVALALAAVLILIGIAALILPHGPKKEGEENTGKEPANVADTEKPAVPEEGKPAPAPAESENVEPKNTAAASTPVPPVVPVDPTAKLAQAEQLAAEKARLAANARKAADAAGSSHEEKKKLQEHAEAAAQEAQKAADDKTALVAGIKKTNEEILASRKQREDARDKAEAEAADAAKVAAEKARLADDAKKAALDVIQQAGEKMAQQQKAETEMQELQKVAADKQQAAAAAAKAAMEAESIYKQQLAAMKQAEDDSSQAETNVARAKNAEAARKAAEEAEQMRIVREQEASRLEKQAAEAQKAADEAMKLVEKAHKAAADAERLRKQSEEARKKAESEAGTAPAPKDVPKEKPSASLLPENLVPESAKLVLKTETKMESTKPNSKTPSLSVRVPETKPTVANTLQNSLGMKFAPVGDVIFSVWLTRVKDFEVFAKATNLKPSSWRRPDFQQGADHPAVNVNWIDAIAFCKWLSEREQKEGLLSANQLYRLPTDLEWSRAVGLPEETGRTPEARDMGIADIYPWGTQWPPPPGAGNYTGEETNSDVAIKGYHDGYPYTSPVSAFSPNKLGLYDMGGNVWQWCMDWWNGEQKAKTLRGGSWYNGALKLSLLSSCRINSPPDKSSDNYGFRVVLATTDANAAKH